MVNREWLCDNRERPARSLAPGVTQAECASNSTTGGSTSLGLAIVGRSSPLLTRSWLCLVPREHVAASRSPSPPAIAAR
jgi:hypothetical protein